MINELEISILMFRSANTERVQPFFPAGLAVSQEQPTRFNFNLFVLHPLTTH